MIPPEPARHQSAPHLALPPKACDAHVHVFGPFDQFPLVHPPAFPAPLAPISAHRVYWSEVGLDRALLVQPAHYGFDHSALLDALSQAPNTRGVGLADSSADLETLANLRSSGVRALRFTDFRAPDGAVRPGSVGLDHLMELAPMMRELGLHAQIWASAERISDRLPDLLRLGLPIVLDHMGMPNASQGVDQPGFAKILHALSGGGLWVKLSVCRVSTQAPTYDDVAPFHDALVEARPDRMLWASDWPFIRMGDDAPDVGRLLDLLFTRVRGDAALREKILCANPAELFAFDDVPKGQ